MTEVPPPHQLLNVLTLNAWGFGWPLARHRAVRFERLARWLEASKHDIVGLQEMWDGARKQLNIERLNWTPAGKRRRRDRTAMTDSGLALKFSDALAAQTKASPQLLHTFGEHRGWDRFKRKGLFGVEVPLDAVGGSVMVVVTHLQASAQHHRTRRKQLDEVLELLDGIDSPVILMGDFNIHAGSAEDRAGHRSMDRAGWVDASEMVDNPAPTYVIGNPYTSGPDERFDRIYLRHGARLRIEATDARVIHHHDSPISDHEALEAQLVISRIAAG
ncbi:MAG: endonuclease/exonuclease/phosphatase family metal-dependent hydrolase [Myxococcota bacterium]|jgi:endonuclease/exonuclease/phosphatase family metal-dependent hydrolase